MSMRERTKVILPLLVAYASGKAVQYRCTPQTAWNDVQDGLSLSNYVTFPERYRLKPETGVEVVYNYRPTNIKTPGCVSNKITRVYIDQAAANKDIETMTTTWGVVSSKEVEL